MVVRPIQRKKTEHAEEEQKKLVNPMIAQIALLSQLENLVHQMQTALSTQTMIHKAQSHAEQKKLEETYESNASLHWKGAKAQLTTLGIAAQFGEVFTALSRIEESVKSSYLTANQTLEARHTTLRQNETRSEESAKQNAQQLHSLLDSIQHMRKTVQELQAQAMRVQG